MSTDRNTDMEELLRSAHAIAIREGRDTAWARFAASIAKLGIGSITARTYRVLPSDEPAVFQHDEALLQQLTSEYTERFGTYYAPTMDALHDMMKSYAMQMLRRYGK